MKDCLRWKSGTLWLWSRGLRVSCYGWEQRRSPRGSNDTPLGDELLKLTPPSRSTSRGEVTPHVTTGASRCPGGLHDRLTDFVIIPKGSPWDRLRSNAP